MSAAVKYIPAVTKGAKGSSQALLQIACSVKPGVRGNREGILDVTEDHVELCVSAKPKDGEANKAVMELVAEVLKVPKSFVSISKGHKSREKTLVVRQADSKASGEQLVGNSVQAFKGAIQE